ncbi:MAG: hypothetical protein ACP5QZ_01660 [Candidatus Sumerlaeaceae bacterium]
MSASQLRACLVWTWRDDEEQRSLICGMCVLKGYELDGKEYTGDGWYAIPQDDRFTPVTNENEINDFREIFKLKRQVGEHGLSVVSPFLDDKVWKELQKGGHLGFWVIKEFFFPILKDTLVVEVEGNNDQWRIDSSFLEDENRISDLLQRVQSSPGEGDSAITEEDVTLLKEQIALTRDYVRWLRREKNISNKTDEVFGEPLRLDFRDHHRDPQWNNSVCAKDPRFAAARERFGSGKPILIHIVLEDPCNRDSYSEFHVLLKRCAESPRKATFIRNDLIISDVHKRAHSSLRECLALVIIPQGFLSELLGDAENPAHTGWDHCLRDKSKYKDKVEPKKFIQFVSDAPQKLVECLVEEDKELSHPFAEYFTYCPQKGDIETADSESAEYEVTEGTQPDVSLPEAPRVNARPLGVNIDSIEGEGRSGFCVKGCGTADNHGRLLIRVAYRVRGGRNPLKAYRPQDFDLKDSTFRIVGQNCEVIWREENQLEIKPKESGSEFSLYVLGFDPKRDLHCEAVMIDEEV